MPLIVCPDCGHQCSPTATTCTDCGRAMPGAGTAPAGPASIAELARSPSPGTSVGATLLMAASVLLGVLGLAVEWASGRPSFGTYIVAILFGIWARLVQANAHHRATIDALRRR